MEHNNKTIGDTKEDSPNAESKPDAEEPISANLQQNIDRVKQALEIVMTSSSEKSGLVG